MFRSNLPKPTFSRPAALCSGSSVSGLKRKIGAVPNAGQKVGKLRAAAAVLGGGLIRAVCLTDLLHEAAGLAMPGFGRDIKDRGKLPAVLAGNPPV